MALIAISSGSSPGSIHLRKIKMLVSSRPWRGRSPLIPAASLLVERRGLVGSEGFQINCGSIGRHSDELWPGDESAPSPQRDQLPDSVAVTGDGKRLPVLDRVHDLPRPHPEVALRDLWVSTHHDMVALRAIWCYKRGRIGQAVRSQNPPKVSSSGTRSESAPEEDGASSGLDHERDLVDAVLAGGRSAA